MKIRDIKLPKVGTKKSLVTQLLIVGALVNLSYNPKSEDSFSETKYFLESENEYKKKLKPIDDEYTLPNRDYKQTNPNFSTDSDTVLLARLVFGEARSCSFLEKISVAYTAVNRANNSVDWYGGTLEESILKRYQYSCFNCNDPNRRKLMDPMKTDSASWANSMKVAKGVLKGVYRDPTNGATHYHTKSIEPYWTKSNKLEKIEAPNDFRHGFYEESI